MTNGLAWWNEQWGNLRAPNMNVQLRDFFINFNPDFQEEILLYVVDKAMWTGMLLI